MEDLLEGAEALRGNRPRRKYEFTGETKVLDSERILQRIRRLSDGALGGWIEKESNLSHDGDCWVGKDACVYGNAKVRDNARVTGQAIVFGNAQVFDNARVCGLSYVFGCATVYNDATVDGRTEVYDAAQIYGNAEVFGDVKIFEHAQVFGKAKVYGDASINGDVRITTT